MSTSTALDRGRAAYADRRWRAAYDELTAADQETGLPTEDVERLAIAADLIGERSEGVDLLARAHSEYLKKGAVAEAAWCASWAGMRLMNAGSQAQASGWFARAERLIAQHGVRCRAAGVLLVARGLGALYGGDPESARQTFEQVAVVAEQFNDPDLTALSRLGSGQALITLGNVEKGLALMDEAMVAVTSGELSPIPAGITYCATIGGCHDAFDLRRAQEWTAALDRWCAAQPDLVPFSGQCQMHRAELYCLHGAWSEAFAVAKQAEERARSGDHNAAFGAHYQQGEVQRLRGDYGAAEICYRLADQAGGSPMPGLALLRLAQGKPQVAQSLIRQALDDPTTAGSRLLPAAVEIELAAGDVAAARAAADRLIATSRDNTMPLLQALASTAGGAVLLAEGDPPEALKTLRRAQRSWQQLNVPYETARCRVLAGRACRAMGDEDLARMEFAAARSIFAELGARPEIEAVDALSGTAASSTSDPLTARECQVLRLVAAGMTNRSIANELFLSEKTVARHLSNIFTKLGLSSRSAATAYAYQHGLA
jgi:DNA-binding NarL/FixJ family response regulator